MAVNGGANTQVIGCQICNTHTHTLHVGLNGKGLVLAQCYSRLESRNSGIRPKAILC